MGIFPGLRLWRRRPRGVVVSLAAFLLVWPRHAAAAAAEPRRADLVADLPAAGDLAAPANGQTLYVLDEARGEVLAVDPFEPTKRWQAVTPSGGTGAATVPVAIGCIDTSMLALVCRGADGWFVHTHRVQPGTAADHSKPAQTVPIGKGAGEARPCLAVSPSRDWLGIVGLPAPLPAVLRAPIAGARIGSLSSRACPGLPAGLRPAAATISPAEEFVLFTADGGERRDAGVFVSFYLPPDPRRLLHLETPLSRIHDAAFCRADNTLWVVGGGGRAAAGDDATAAAQPEGLWRIDAVLRNGRQAASAVCVARLPGARAVVCLSERAIIVTHGREARTVSRIDPTQPASQP